MRSFKLNLKSFSFPGGKCVHWIGRLLDLFGFNPGADSKNLIKIQRDLLVLNKPLDVSLDGCGKNPHEGLGSEPVLGPLLVVTLGHVSEHEVGGLVDVMDDLSKVGLEVSVGQVL